jgi:Holliday junction resolvase RusA-like endonuclease
MIIDIVPVPKPRMTQRDKWLDPPRPCAGRYFAFCEELRLKCPRLPESWATGIVVIDFYLPMPASWSKAKVAKHRGMPHQQKPDVDNLVKAFLDSVYDEDCHVYDEHGRKFWSDKGYIEIF